MIVVELGHSILVFQQSLVGIWRLTFRVLGVDIGVIEVIDVDPMEDCGNMLKLGV